MAAAAAGGGNGGGGGGDGVVVADTVTAAIVVVVRVGDGMTFGIGIPVVSMFSNLNLAVEIGKRGTTDANLVEEKFANLKMSLSLNDRWFVKRKYN